MKQRYILLLTLILILFIGACKKKDDSPAKTKTENLCASPWLLTSILVEPTLIIGGTQITDMFSLADACEKDDKTKYESNKTGINDEGAIKCDPLDPQTSPFTWSFDLTETKITKDGEIMDIVQLDESTFKTSMVYDGDDIGGVSGVKYKLTMIFKH